MSRTNYTRIAVAAALVAMALTSTGCFYRVPIENSDTGGSTTKSVPLQGATSVETHLSMGAGELTVAGEDLAGDALEGEFVYSPARLAPQISNTLEGDILRVSVGHRENNGVPFGNLKSDWDVKLANSVPTELSLDLGAGQAIVDLSDVDVTKVAMNLGAGETRLDLTGPRSHSVTGLIQAGAGQIVIRLPKDLPVRVTGRQDGVGDWSAEGFSAVGNSYVNDAWQESQTGTTDYKGTIELNVQRGIGEVRLELAD